MRKRNWEPLAECLGVFALIMLYIWWLRLEHPWLWLVLLGVVIGSQVQRREGPLRLGFGWRAFRAALRPVAVWVAILAGSLLALGAALGSTRPVTPGQAAAGIAAYTLWGLVQQYLLNGYFVNRLAEFSGKSAFVPLAAALLFSAVHLPNWFLMGVTLAGGYVCARVYLRFHSLYALALAHGAVGFTLFLVVPDSVSAHFLVGPRYLIDIYGVFPPALL